MLRARQAYFAAHGGIASLDAVIPTADSEDTATLYNYLADQTLTGIDPEADLLTWEYIDHHVYDVDMDDDEPAPALFTMSDEPDDDTPLIIVDVKPPRPRTGRAARLKSQLTLDFEGGEYE